MRTPFHGLVASACSRPLALDRSRPVRRPPGSGRPEAVRLPVYEGVLRHPAGADLGGRWRHVLRGVVDLPGAAEAEERDDCSDSFSASEQAALAGRLRDLHGDVRAGGATWLLRWRAAAWEVTGPKDGQWIS